MSPNQPFPSGSGTGSPIARRVIADPQLSYELTPDGLAIAVKGEMVVRRSAREASAELHNALTGVAAHSGTLATIAHAEQRQHPTGVAAARFDPDGPAGNIELWRLQDPDHHSIKEARRLRELAHDEQVLTGTGSSVAVPAVAANHVGILSPTAWGCPASPPVAAPDPHAEFLKPIDPRPAVRVTVLDSGYIYIQAPNQPHTLLDERVTLVDGAWLDTQTVPPSWQPDQPDSASLDASGELDGITGHGTFIAGLVAHICPEAAITVVGLRDQESSGKSGLFASEFAIARALLHAGDTDVIQCGFAFPTVDNAPPVALAAAIEILKSPQGPHGGQVAIVAPAGNEHVRAPYWPAAFPDVIGVAATNRREDHRAHFSNWGKWCDCCCRGEDVYSTFIYFTGPIEGEPASQIQHFNGWAYWDGTSFAAPKVSAAIARRVAESGRALSPMQAWKQLVTGEGGVTVSAITDYEVTPPGVTLPQLWLG